MTDTAFPFKSRRGFAAIADGEKRKAIAAKGGRRAHELKVAHEWDHEEAKEAGRRGGLNSRGGRGKAASVEESNV